MQAQTNEAAARAAVPELRLSREFHTPRGTVFKAWSSTDHVKRWFCPSVFTIPVARVQMHVGGPFEVCMRGPDGVEHWTRGRFTEVVPNERLVIEMDATDAAGKTLFKAQTTVTFADTFCGTRLDVVQTYTVLDPAALPMIGGATIGWGETLDRLQAELGRMANAGEAARSAVHAIFHLERTYDASAALVWKALTDAEAKARWFCGVPGRWQLLERRMDVRPGGRERLKGRWEGGDVTDFDAVYFDVVPQERLVYAYDMYHNDRKLSVSLATVQLTADGGKTKLAVTEQGVFLDGYEDAGSREHGTGELLDALGASLNPA
jgi:uncharacterized protein YndB with AHSA1/START domain